MRRGLSFLKIFPETVQETDIAKTFKRRKNERTKSLVQVHLDMKNASIKEFRETLFLYCGWKRCLAQSHYVIQSSNHYFCCVCSSLTSSCFY